MSSPSRQLPLSLAQSLTYDAAAFYPSAGSRLAAEWLERPNMWTNGRLFMWGETGAGKTHLLHMWAATHFAQRINYASLPDESMSVSTPLAIDNADLITDEPRLFHLLNGASHARQPVLLAAREPPARQSIGLADLASRLRASTVIEVFPPANHEHGALLACLAASRQLVLSVQVQKFLLTHLPRTPAALVEAIARLDRASLATGGKISRTLAAGLLKDIASMAPAGPEMLSNGHSQDTPGLL